MLLNYPLPSNRWSRNISVTLGGFLQYRVQNRGLGLSSWMLSTFLIGEHWCSREIGYLSASWNWEGRIPRPDTRAHVLMRCPALMSNRHRFLGSIHPRVEEGAPQRRRCDPGGRLQGPPELAGVQPVDYVSPAETGGNPNNHNYPVPICGTAWYPDLTPTANISTWTRPAKSHLTLFRPCCPVWVGDFWNWCWLSHAQSSHVN